MPEPTEARGQRRPVVRRGRPADEVPAGYVRLRQLSEDGLLVTVRGDRGQSLGDYDFSLLPVAPDVQRMLAAAFSARSGALGSWKSRATCKSGYDACRAFATWMAGRDRPPLTGADVTPAVWSEWALQTSTSNSTRMRPLMLAMPGLPDDTRRRADKTVLRVRRSQRPSMTGEEIKQVKTAAGAVFRQARDRIRGNAELLDDWRAGRIDTGTDRWHIGLLLDRVSTQGCVGSREWKALPEDSLRAYARSIGHPDVKVARAPSFRLLNERLHLNTHETIAAALLMVIKGDYNFAPMEVMDTTSWRPDGHAGGPGIHTVAVDKARRGDRSAHTSESLVDRGPGSLGRLYADICQATQPARDMLRAVGAPTDRLFVYRPAHPVAREGELPGGLRVGIPANRGTTWVAWAAETGLVSSDGLPMSASPQALRGSLVPRRNVPRHHSQQTHDNAYALPDARATGSHEEVVEAGLYDARDHALQTVGVTWLTLGDRRAARVAQSLGVPVDLAERILSGRQDTAAAACTDHRNGPHAPPGHPCPASFLSCFACGNAIATPDHLPRLVYLDKALENLHGTVAPDFWNRHYADPAERLRRLLDEHSTPAERRQALGRLDPGHAEIIEDLLSRKWDA